MRALRPHLCLMLLWLAPWSAGQTDVLPSPLTLHAALTLADEAHPHLQWYRAQQMAAEAEALQAQSHNRLQLGLELNPRWIDPNPQAPIRDNDDSRALLSARQPLYDFGRSRSLQNSAQTQIRSRELEWAQQRQQHRLNIMAAYFDVLLADLTYTRDNEAMAVAFVELNRQRNRHELGRVSDVDLLADENHFQQARLQRLSSLQQQRARRQHLANILNRPEQLPAQLRAPELRGNDRQAVDFNELLTQAMQSNAQLLAHRLELEAASQAMAAARAQRRPTLSAEAQAGWWNREFGGDRNPYMLGLVLDLPLYQGGQENAALVRAQAAHHAVIAELQLFELRLRQELLDTWLEIQRLRTQREQAQIHADYRDLYLDRSRSLYEMEVATDFGDSMMRQSEAILFTAETEFRLALAWERLAILVGEPELSTLTLRGDGS
ncbi:TolC family protein [Ectothiorhodosinus mongolicus]|nr:TolC family protein [Ectothiorhodosinus mongolicus]